MLPSILLSDEEKSTAIKESDVARKLEEHDKITGNNEEDMILEVVDRLEDEMDHPYEELVPLELKLALEDKVFGWSHLSSEILGHVFFTVGAFFVCWNALRLIQQIIGVQSLSDDFLYNLNLLCSIAAAVSAFRMVRRRTKIWFRAAYGSKAYRADEKRRSREVAKTDKTTLLGRIRQRRDAYLHRGIIKKLKTAEERFQRKLSKKSASPTSVTFNSDSAYLSSTDESGDEIIRPKRRPSFQTFPTYATKSLENDQVSFPKINLVPYSHGGFFGAAPFMLANADWVSILRHLMPDVYVEISRRAEYAAAPKLIHWAENNPVVAAFGTAHELENSGQLVNLEWDVFLDPHLVKRVEVCLEQKENFLSSIGEVDGIALSQEQKSILHFLDEELQKRVDQLVDETLIAHGSLPQLIMEQTGFAKHYNFSRVKRTRRTLGGGMFVRRWLAVYAEALRLGVCLGHIPMESQTGRIIKTEDSNEELSTRARTLSDQTEYATYIDATPMASAETPMSKCVGKEISPGNEEAPGGNSADSIATSLVALSSSKCPNTNLKDSIRLIRKITKKRQPVGLILDIKSRHVSKKVWAIVVEKLRKAGARVEGVASFTVDEIRDISKFCSRNVKEVVFCHSAGDMQQGCHDGRIRPGDTVFFNAGSLLWDAPPFNTKLVKERLCSKFDARVAMKKYELMPFGKCVRGSVRSVDPSTVQAYQKKLDLSIGVYVQEFSIDESALSLLVQFCNDFMDIYCLGLSWGGLNGVTVKGIKPGRFTKTDGFWNQRYAGVKWDSSLNANMLSNYKQ